MKYPDAFLELVLLNLTAIADAASHIPTPNYGAVQPPQLALLF